MTLIVKYIYREYERLDLGQNITGCFTLHFNNYSTQNWLLIEAQT
jgi:hypothetical protein